MDRAASKIEDEIRQTEGLKEMAAAADLPDAPPRKNIFQDSKNHADAPHGDTIVLIDVGVEVVISVDVDGVHVDAEPVDPPPQHTDTPHGDSY